MFRNACAHLPLVLVFLGILAIRELQVYPANETKGKFVFRRTDDPDFSVLELELCNTQQLNKWFIKYFAVCSQ